ncbi:hypothetical protein C0V82_16840 [Niveispirillum cyanobacteriorum]|uniref:Uncharacterized protein n=2 Tax=Niveispirillum cyanobacteriorum TaxID=1612173 RepID=A0A2K9NG38_9PROT|nr:hypothetical protein C0V82_16840 [Niveispirillum cyanobacteriorum]
MLTLIDSMPTGKSFLVAADILEHRELYDRLIRKEFPVPFELSLKFHFNGEVRFLNIIDVNSIFYYLLGDFFGLVTTLSISGGKIIFHNDHPANISLVVADKGMIDTFCAEWDAAFCFHQQYGAGVGFAEAGEAYVQEVLARLAAVIPDEMVRISRLSACVGRKTPVHGDGGC